MLSSNPNLSDIAAQKSTMYRPGAHLFIPGRHMHITGLVVRIRAAILQLESSRVATKTHRSTIAM